MRNMRREDASRVGWAGIGTARWEQLERDKITQEELEKIRKGIRPGDHVIWKVYTYPKEYLGGSRYPLVQKRLTITGCYRHLATAVGKNGQMYSMTYVEMAMERRQKRGQSAGKQVV